jgi:hypothetical protein
MKRLLVVIMIMTVAWCFFGCGGGKDNKAATGTETKGTATPATSIAVGSKATAEQVGVKFYPGATEVGNKTEDAGNRIVTTIDLTTPDTLDKVLDFYKTEFKSDPEEAIPGATGHPSWEINVSDKITNRVTFQDIGPNRQITIEHTIMK